MTISGSNPSAESNDSSEQHNSPLVLSNGSARVFLATGETHVLVSVKAELVTPAMSHPGCGVLDINVDYMHNPQGKTSNKDDSLAPTISSLLLPHLVDPKQLCVVPHHFVWKLHLDVMVLASNGGSLLDACSLGMQAALRNTVLPKLTSEKAPDGGRPVLQIDADLQNAVPIPGSEQTPIISTVSLLKANAASSGNTAPILILDATQQEEACAVSQVHVVLDRSNQNQKEPLICAIHKAGGGALPFSLLQDVTSFVLETKSGAAKVCSGNAHEHLLQETFLLQ
ncbi:MAG: hypothetical protein SGBAC_001406 [Bacillariaceae sp.]